MATVSGKAARIRYTSATATSSTDNACTRSTGAGAANGYVQIDSTARRHWNRNNSTSIKLYVEAAGSTTLVGSTQYDVNFVWGRFDWRSGDPSTGTYTADVEFLTASYLGRAQAWTLDGEVDMLEDTSFSTSATDTQWRTFQPGLSQAEATLERFATTGTTGPLFFDRLNAGQDLLAELWLDSANRNKFEGFARVAGDGRATNIEELATEGVTLQFDDTLYYSTF